MCPARHVCPSLAALADTAAGLALWAAGAGAARAWSPVARGLPPGTPGTATCTVVALVSVDQAHASRDGSSVAGFHGRCTPRSSSRHRAAERILASICPGAVSIQLASCSRALSIQAWTMAIRLSWLMEQLSPLNAALDSSRSGRLFRTSPYLGGSSGGRATHGGRRMHALFGCSPRGDAGRVPAAGYRPTRSSRPLKASATTALQGLAPVAQLLGRG